MIVIGIALIVRTPASTNRTPRTRPVASAPPPATSVRTISAMPITIIAIENARVEELYSWRRRGMQSTA